MANRRQIENGDNMILSWRAIFAAVNCDDCWALSHLQNFCNWVILRMWDSPYDQNLRWATMMVSTHMAPVLFNPRNESLKIWLIWFAASVLEGKCVVEVIIMHDHSWFQLDIDRRHTRFSLSTTHEKSLTHNIPGASTPGIIRVYRNGSMQNLTEALLDFSNETRALLVK